MNNEQRFQYVDNFIKELKSIQYQKYLKEKQIQYQLYKFKILQLTTDVVKQLYIKLILRLDKYAVQKNQLCWYENQLRLFVWFFLTYYFVKNNQVSQLKEEEIIFFSTLFPNKNTILFEFQCLHLIKSVNSTRKWCKQQDQLFLSVIQKYQYKSMWSQIAKKLYIISQKKYFRTAKQCRQRWLNHLNPHICQNSWQQKQDYILLKYVQRNGKKWAKIAKILNQCRNQHSVKNRFKSLINRQQKFHHYSTTQNQLIQCILNKYQNNIPNNKNYYIEPKQNKKFHHTNFINHNVENYTRKKQIFQISTQEKIKSQFFPIVNYTKQPNNFIQGQSYPFQRNSSFNINSLQQNEALKTQYHFEQPQSMTVQNSKQLAKQIRVDIFLTQEPFELLKQHFKCR